MEAECGRCGAKVMRLRVSYDKRALPCDRLPESFEADEYGDHVVIGTTGAARAPQGLPLPMTRVSKHDCPAIAGSRQSGAPRRFGSESPARVAEPQTEQADAF